MTGAAQRIHDVRRSGEASLDAVPARDDEFCQPLPCQPRRLLIKKAKDDGQRVRRLCIAVNGAVIVDVMITKGSLGALGEISEVRGFWPRRRSSAVSATIRASR